MRTRLRRHRFKETELDITAFLNLMVALIPFLLITAVFSRITILELNIPKAPPPGASQPQQAPIEVPLVIEIVVRKNLIDVTDNKGGLIKRFVNKDGKYDLKGLTELLQRMKDRVPDKKDASVLLEPDTSYETVVQVMDTVRYHVVRNGGVTVNAELFPDISMGDAPPLAAAR